ncbi:hypothetical protein TREMEDRAFT_66461 [Tremella mesenterica DSM 1558]|uniref:uncharacterized protein n=1 Tax=Tremella mesenterica (strain ATCC 24925 / CBS 8224 / DSM 1558 / NBRC 9311 / NRRL Y-6157 / RJB 2259-6 / UBC 559-6) TaxID=578456 RepID=UPI00032C0D46|nr:uncharacterized protein TREMEDRAFT_66461 [Tremella mesenterica DSM 1558]EIW65548.1 hypothetical protein TREMEDRAFT_66461 [Tremella mesenterica DSM 1558]
MFVLLAMMHLQRISFSQPMGYVEQAISDLTSKRKGRSKIGWHNRAGQDLDLPLAIQQHLRDFLSPDSLQHAWDDPGMLRQCVDVLDVLRESLDHATEVRPENSHLRILDREERLVRWGLKPLAGWMGPGGSLEILSRK